MSALWLPADSDIALALREPNLLIENKKYTGLVQLKNWVPHNANVFDLRGPYVTTYRKVQSFTKVGSPTQGFHSGDIGTNFGGSDQFYHSEPNLNVNTGDWVLFCDGIYNSTGTFRYALSQTIDSGGYAGAIIGIYNGSSPNNTWTGVFRDDGSSNTVQVVATGKLTTTRSVVVLARIGTTLYLVVNGEIFSNSLNAGDSATELNTTTLGGRRYQSANNFCDGKLFLAGAIPGTVPLARIVSLSRNLYGELFVPCNQSPFLVSVPAGPSYDETISSSVTSAAAISETYDAPDYSEVVSSAATTAASLVETYELAAAYVETIGSVVFSAAALVETYDAPDYAEVFASAVTTAAALVETYDAPDYSEVFASTVSSVASLVEQYELGAAYEETLASAVTASASLVEQYTAPNYAEVMASAVTTAAVMAEAYDINYSESIGSAVTSVASLGEQFESGLSYVESIQSGVTTAATLLEAYGAPDYAEILDSSVAVTANMAEQFSTPQALPGLLSLTARSVKGYYATRP